MFWSKKRNFWPQKPTKFGKFNYEISKIFLLSGELVTPPLPCPILYLFSSFVSKSNLPRPHKREWDRHYSCYNQGPVLDISIEHESLFPESQSAYQLCLKIAKKNPLFNHLDQIQGLFTLFSLNLCNIMLQPLDHKT